jgi:hypothetical protein
MLKAGMPRQGGKKISRKGAKTQSLGEEKRIDSKRKSGRAKHSTELAPKSF